MSLRNLIVVFSAASGVFGHHVASTLCSDTATVTTTAAATATAMATGRVANEAFSSPPSGQEKQQLQVSVFLGQLELAFYAAGVANATEWGTQALPDDALRILQSISAQEEIQLQSMADLLVVHRAPAIPPCNYSFPIVSADEFLRVAHLISSVGVSATIGLAGHLAATDPVLAEHVSSVLAVKSRHNAFFRLLLGLAPSPIALDVGIPALWAYNAALGFVVPGSCPLAVPLPVLPELIVTDTSGASSDNQTDSTASLLFRWDAAQMSFVVNRGKPLLVGWVNQPNKPLYTALNITGQGEGTAEVPEGLAGVAFVALTTQPYDTVDELAGGTLAGPAVVLVS